MPNHIPGRIGPTSGSCARTSLYPTDATPPPTLRVDRMTRPPIVPWNQRSTLGVARAVKYSGYSRAIAARIHRIMTSREGTCSCVGGIETGIKTNDSSAGCSGFTGRHDGPSRNGTRCGRPHPPPRRQRRCHAPDPALEERRRLAERRRTERQAGPAVADLQQQLTVIRRVMTTAQHTRVTVHLHGQPEPPQLRSEEHTSELQSRGHLVCR